MAEKNKPENRSRMLDELQELNQQDRISSIQFSEPELHDFNASSIFEIDEEAHAGSSKRKIFGKRSARRANIKVKSNTYESKNRIQEEIRINSGTSPEPKNEKPAETIQKEVFVPVLDPDENGVHDTEVQIQTIETKPEPRNEEVVQEEIDQEEIVSVALDKSEEGDVEEDPVFEEEIEEIDEVQDEDEDEPEEEEEIEQETIRIEQLQVKDFDETSEDEDEEEDELEEEEEDEDEDENEEEVDEYKNEFYDEDEQDLYEDKKRFLLSQYPLIEAYLAEQSSEGYHFVRHIGKKYYFVYSEPKPYYYSINYFRDEPSAEEWRAWESDGWKLIAKAPAKNKHEAGWFTFRNLQKEGEYKKEIDNEEEKYRFFRKYANSCRSTMFLIFVVMACCVVTAFLQYEFQGYLWGLIVCGILFVMAFVAFCEYGRMLRNAKKRARLLQARLRVKEKQLNSLQQDQAYFTESEADLESEWETLNEEEEEVEEEDD